MGACADLARAQLCHLPRCMSTAALGPDLRSNRPIGEFGTVHDSVRAGIRDEPILRHRMLRGSCFGAGLRISVIFDLLHPGLGRRALTQVPKFGCQRDEKRHCGAVPPIYLPPAEVLFEAHFASRLQACWGELPMSELHLAALAHELH